MEIKDRRTSGEGQGRAQGGGRREKLDINWFRCGPGQRG